MVGVGREGEEGESCPSGGEGPLSDSGDDDRLSSISSISNRVLDVSPPDVPSSESVRLREGVKEEVES